MTEKEELELRAENARLKRENTGLRTQLFFIFEEQKEMDKRYARRMSVNGTGQHFCPRCFACVWEPPNVPQYWRLSKYASKTPPK